MRDYVSCRIIKYNCLCLIVGHKNMVHSRFDAQRVMHNTQVDEFLPRAFSGFKMREQEVNCDWLIATKPLQDGKLFVKRHIPDYFEVKS